MGLIVGLKKALAMPAEQVIAEVKDSGLRGRGGAGFPTGVKWGFVPKDSPKPKYLICNADEGDPGAFMDRLVLESDPHRVVEGLAIAALAVGAEEGFFYIRAEYPLAVRRVRRALEQAREAGFLMGELQLPFWWYRLVHFHVQLRPVVSLLEPVELHQHLVGAPAADVEAGRDLVARDAGEQRQGAEEVVAEVGQGGERIDQRSQVPFGDAFVARHREMHPAALPGVHVTYGRIDGPSRLAQCARLAQRQVFVEAR